jgi:hypothetical protein
MPYETTPQNINGNDIMPKIIPLDSAELLLETVPEDSIRLKKKTNKMLEITKIR